MNSTLTLVIHVLAVHRLIDLWTADRITMPARARAARWLYQRRGFVTTDPSGVDAAVERAQFIITASPTDIDEFARHDDGRPTLAWLIYCRACVGLWLAIGYTTLVLLAPVVATWSSIALATGAAAGLLQLVIARLDNDHD